MFIEEKLAQNKNEFFGDTLQLTMGERQLRFWATRLGFDRGYDTFHK